MIMMFLVGFLWGMLGISAYVYRRDKKNEVDYIDFILLAFSAFFGPITWIILGIITYLND
jgi:hypothetical protein